MLKKEENQNQAQKACQPRCSKDSTIAVGIMLGKIFIEIGSEIDLVISVGRWIAWKFYPIILKCAHNVGNMRQSD